MVNGHAHNQRHPDQAQAPHAGIPYHAGIPDEVEAPDTNQVEEPLAAPLSNLPDDCNNRADSYL